MRRLCARVILAALLLAAPSGLQAQSREAPSGQNPADRQQREQALEPIREAHRSAKKAVAMTMMFPGWGQMYADSPFWGIVGFTVQMYYLGNILLEARRVERQRIQREALDPESNERITRDALVQEHKEKVRDFLWWTAGGFLILSLDAFVSVELADFDSGEPPTPDLDRQWDEPSSSGDGVALRLNFSF